MHKVGRLAAVAAAATALASCVVGPDYKGPPRVAQEAISAGRFVRAGSEVTATQPKNSWWLALNDVELNRLEQRALRGGPDLAIVSARVYQARAGLHLKRAERAPKIGVEAVAVRQQTSFETISGGASSILARGAGSVDDAIGVYEAGFDASWEPDLFGAEARAVEGARASAQAADLSARDAQVSLTAEVAQCYVQVRAVQEHLALLSKNVEIERRLLDLTKARQSGGEATELDVVRLVTQLEISRAELPSLQAAFAEEEDHLALLVGSIPGSLDAELATPMPTPPPPAFVAVGDPAALIRRRPDVRAAERRIEQQTALVGQRTADLFPKVSLIGDIGFGSTDFGGVLSGSGFTSTIVPVLHWSPFAFGRTEAKVSQAEGLRQEALATFRRAVLAALEDAENALTRYGRQTEHLADLMKVRAAVDRAAQLVFIRFWGGSATTLDVLDAERERIDAETKVVQARAELTQDFVSLQKSLGLGWDEI